jgi:hypothetical protein
MPGSRKKQIERERSTSSKTNTSASQKSPGKPRAKPLSAEKHPKSTTPEKTESAGRVEYKTILDEIYALVNQEGEITLAALSKRTNIAEPKLEEWGRIFDKQGMLELCYPFVGGAILRRKGYISKADEKKKASLAGPAKTAPLTDSPDSPQAIALDSPPQAAGKAAAGKNAAPISKGTEAGQKPKPRKSTGLILIILVVILLALIGVAAYLLIKGGYIGPG